MNLAIKKGKIVIFSAKVEYSLFKEKGNECEHEKYSGINPT